MRIPVLLSILFYSKTHYNNHVLLKSVCFMV